MNARERFLMRCSKQYENQALVTIRRDKIFEIASSVSVSTDDVSWDFYLPKSLQVAAGTDGELLCEVSYYFFVMIALQFCFWEKDGQGQLLHWHYQNNPKLKGSAGYAQLMVDQYNAGKFPGVHLNAAETLSHYTQVFTSCGIPHAVKRAQILQTLADFNEFKSKTCPELLGRTSWGVVMAQLLANVYEEAYLDPYYKKIQLFLGLLAGNLRARGLQAQTDLTVYSDYRIPQVLRHLGVLEYAPQLASVVDGGCLLSPNGEEERAIRSATIVACEEMAQAAGLSCNDVDCFLFLKTRDESFMQGIKPFHLCETTNY